MNEISKKKFLLKASDESQYRILSRNNGISILKAEQNGNWTEIASTGRMHPCFYANIDSRDLIHIISQDLRGNIIYSKINNGNLISLRVLESTSANAFDRSFFMLFRSDGPVFFYTVRKQFETILVGQFISEKKALIPIPLSKVPDTINPYWITSLGQNTGLILFPRVSGLYTQICAAKIWLDTLKLTSDRIITEEDGNCESPKCIVLFDGSVHMLYSSRKKGKFHLKYQKGTVQGFDFAAAETIAVSKQTFTKYNLEYSNNKLNINWQEGGYIYFRDKTLYDASFSEIKTFKSYRLRTIEYYHSKFNSPNKPSPCYSTEQPLSLEGKIQYAFYREGENIPFNKKKEPQTKKASSTASQHPIFRALTDYLASREDISEARQNNIQRIGDIIIELSRLFYTSNQKNSRKEKDPFKRTFSLGKPKERHRYKLKVNKK